MREAAPEQSTDAVYLAIISPRLDPNTGQMAYIGGQRYLSEPDRHRLGEVRERSPDPSELWKQGSRSRRSGDEFTRFLSATR